MLVDDFADRVRNEVLAIAETYDTPLHFGAVNFGGRIGSSVPLGRVQRGSLPSLPRREVIPYTDFRLAFEFALVQVEGSPGQSVVVLITDAEPWPPGVRLGTSERRAYFGGTGRFSEPPQRSLADALARIREAAGEVVVLAVQDREVDAKLWRDHIPQANYISTRESLNPISDFSRLLARIAERGQGPSLHKDPKLWPQPSLTKGTIAANNATPGLPPKCWLPAPILGTALAVCLLWALKLRHENKSLRRQVQELTPDAVAEVEELKEEARVLAKKDRTKAKRKYEEALTKSVTLIQEAELAGKMELSKIISGMLKDLCSSVEEERQLVAEMLEDGRPKELARSLASVLFPRWAENTTHLLPEFDSLRIRPLGPSFLEGFADLPVDKDEPHRGFRVAVQSLARSAHDLDRFVEA